MENQEIIELGSSDDEAGPPTSKKAKPLANAMVHIPKTISIKPISSNISHKHKDASGKSLPVTGLVNTIIDSKSAASSLKNISNGRYTQNSTSKTIYKNIINDKSLPNKKKLNINPINILTHRSLLNRTANVSKFIQPAVNVHQQQVLTKLPPSITITRTQGANKSVKSPEALGMDKFKVNNKIAISTSFCAKKKVSRLGEVLTVDLDDDNSESSSATGSPQWYLRPEEQNTSNILEEKNNMEPEPRKMIEISIEDSPVKPCLLKETDTNKDLFITIEDSPKKLMNDAVTEGIEKEKTKSPHSKKQLNYPKNNESLQSNEKHCESGVEHCESNETIVMDVDIDGNKLSENKKTLRENLEVEECGNQKDIQLNKQNHKTNNENEVHVPEASVAEKKAQIKNVVDEKMNSLHKDSDSSNDEFHPIVQRFINLCCEIDKTDDMKKIIDKRIKNYYRQVPKAYVESEEFLDLVSTKMLMTEADPTKMYLYLKDVVDELNLQRKMAKTCHIANQQNSLEDADADADDHNINHSSKQQRQIRKLEKTIKKLNRAIIKLEEQEVDFDDEEDSVYLLTERYKERLIRVYEKLCKMSNTKMPSEAPIQIHSKPGQPPGPAKKLEKYINKKVPLGTPLPFPDFHDVLKCVREANEEDRLGWNEVEIMHEARALFTNCGKKLQRRRQENEWRLATSRVTQSVDPAEKDISLKNKLDDNKMLAERKETEIFNRYAEKQKQLQLEATEIADKEADESPEESEDEELNDNSNSLDDRQKRKDRLRRLLEEKARKLAKETEPLYNEIKKKTLDGSLSSDNKDDNTKSEKPNDISCSQKKITYNVRDITKSENLKTTVCEDQNAGNRNFVESDSSKDDVNNKTENYVKSKETEIIDEFTVNEGVINRKSGVGDNVYLISDDSDADELNLLQKLHSGSEISESSESEATIVADSDTSNANSESEDNESYDVISIENSSYSESEPTKHDSSADIKTINKDIEVQCNSTDEVCDINFADTALDTEMNSNYDENLLLASSEDEDKINKSNDPLENDCINVITEEPLNDDADNKSSHGYVNLNDDEITISETFIGKMKNVDGTNIAVDENSENIEENATNEEGNNCTDDKPSEWESNNDKISDKESCIGSVNCNDTKKSPNNIGCCSKIDTSNEIIYGILTDTIKNVESDKSDHSYCGTRIHFGEGIQTINGVKNCTENISFTQSTSSEEIGDNLGTIKLAPLNANSATEVHNSSNVTTRNQCILPSEKCTDLAPETKSIEMMLEEMFNAING